MWILIIFLIEAIRFITVLSYIQASGHFTGILGTLTFIVVDWLFFFVALPVLWHYVPLPRFKPGNALGEWIRGQFTQLSFDTTENAPELVPDQSYVFACHGHGVLATAQLLMFMLPPTDIPGLGGYHRRAVSTVSSQLLAMPLTSIVCRALGAVSISHFNNLVSHGQPFVLSPGGAPEISLVQFDTADTLHIHKRTGFLLQCFLKKRPIVPLLTLGNHTMYRTPSFLRPVQWFLYKTIGYGMPMPAFGEYGSIVPQRSSRVSIVRLPTFLPASEEENFDAYTKRYYDTLIEAASQRNVGLVLVDSECALQMLAG